MEEIKKRMEGKETDICIHMVQLDILHTEFDARMGKKQEENNLVNKPLLLRFTAKHLHIE